MEEYYLMWLTRIDGIGLKRAHRLLEHFGSAEAVWRAEPSAIRRSAILGEKLTEGLLLSREEDQLNDWIIELEEKEIDFYSYWHPRYPRLLREIRIRRLGFMSAEKFPMMKLIRLLSSVQENAPVTAQRLPMTLRRTWVRPM